MKRAVIVHCWGGEPVYAWYPWVKEELKKNDYAVSVPEMPDADQPKVERWVSLLKEVIGEPDEDLVLIGHSLGCVTIMRYLESMGKDKMVGKVIFVAGFTDPLGFKELENFFKKPLNYNKIKSKSKNGFVAIQSDDDPFVSEQYGNRLVEEFDAKLIVKEDAGHMSGDLDDDSSCSELPEVLEEVLDEYTHVEKGEQKRRGLRIPKPLRSVGGIVVSIVLLLILFAGGGLAYTYYSGKNSSDASAAAAEAAASATAAANQPIKAGKTSSKTPEGVAINLLTSPVARGSTASMSVQTLPASKCTIVVTYGKAVVHTAGLTTQTADDFGTAAWDWTVSKTAPIGKGSAKVTCTVNKKTAVVIGDIQITK
jgi:uncharacterized protein